MQLALHKKHRNKWSKNVSHKNKLPFAMTILANGRPAQLTTWYSTMCLCFEALLTQSSRIPEMKCARDTIGQEVNAQHLPYCGLQLAILLQVEFF